MVEKTQDEWLDNVKAPIELKEMKGKVIKILEPREIKTKDYGERKIIEIIVEGKEGQTVVTEYLPDGFPVIANNSNIGKIMKKYECKTLKELIGKDVELIKAKQDFLKIKKD